MDVHLISRRYSWRYSWRYSGELVFLRSRLARGVQAAVGLDAALKVGASAGVRGVPGGLEVTEQRLGADAGDERRPGQPGHLIELADDHAAAGHVGESLAPRRAATHAAGRDHRVAAGPGGVRQLIEDFAERQARAGPRGVEQVGARVPGSEAEDGRRGPDVPAARPEEGIAGQDRQSLGLADASFSTWKPRAASAARRPATAELAQVMEPVDDLPGRTGIRFEGPAGPGWQRTDQQREPGVQAERRPGPTAGRVRWCRRRRPVRLTPGLRRRVRTYAYRRRRGGRAGPLVVRPARPRRPGARQPVTRPPRTRAASRVRCRTRTRGGHRPTCPPRRPSSGSSPRTRPRWRWLRRA